MLRIRKVVRAPCPECGLVLAVHGPRRSGTLRKYVRNAFVRHFTQVHPGMSPRTRSTTADRILNALGRAVE